MKIGVLMLGDLHFFSRYTKDRESKHYKNEFISNRIESLLKLLESQLATINDIILIVNGDITNEGSAKEFSSAYYFLNKIKSFLLEKSITSYFVFSPGNHDLNLGNDKEENKLKNYYTFVKRFVDYCDIEKSKYYDVYTIKTLGTNINFISMNPFSQIKSLDDLRAKKFFIDSNQIKNNLRVSKKEINIFLSHFPLFWYDRNNINNYRFLEEQNFTIYSHEHNETKIILENNKICISLNCFSEETRQENCGIVFGYFDSITTAMELQAFNYTSDGFIPYIEEKFYLTNFIGYDNSNYKLYKNSYDKFMNEDISTLCGEEVNFLDLFAEPRFYVTNDSEYDKGKTEIKNLSDLMAVSSYYVFITGNKSGGKTSVLKYIFSEELKKGNCPIYVKINIKNVVNGIEEKIQKFVSQNYVNNYEEIKAEKKVILLIDDFDLIQNPQELGEIKKLLPYVSKVYIAANDEFSSIKLSLVANDINFFKIQPFGYEARYKLVNNWVQCNYNLDLESDKNSINVKIFSLLNSISSDILLSPELVLIFLNAYKSNDSNNLINSTKIVYYKYLITKYIVEICNEVTLSNKNIVEFFYRDLAFFYFKNPEGNIQEFHNYFLKNYTINPEEYYTNLKFLKNNAFFSLGTSEKFKLSFFKAYFVAEFYKANMTTTEIRDEFYNLIDNVFKDNLYVNIILFFLHNNTQEEYLNRCIERMRAIFKDEKLFNFNSDIKVFNDFIKDVKNEVKKEGDVINNNIELYKKLDKEIEKNEDNNEKSDLEEVLIASNNYLEICSEILPIIGKKDIVNNLLKNMIELSLRILSNFVSLSKKMIGECKNDEELDYIFYTSLAIISAMLDNISTKISSMYLYTADVLDSYNLVSTECIKRKIELILLRKNNNDSISRINSVVNYKEKLLREKNFIAGIFLLMNIDIELNYIGAYDGKNTNLLIEKTNKYALSFSSSNPRIEMNNIVNRKNIRRKKNSKVTIK